MSRKVIYIDIDDTFLQSSKEIIRQLNIQNRTNKTIDDLKDYGFRSIDKNMTNEKVLQMFGSQEFFDNVEFTDNAIELVNTLQKEYDIVFVSYGDTKNIDLKNKFLNRLCVTYDWNNVSFQGILHNEKKSKIKPKAYFAIDNHSDCLQEYNAEKRILFKNNQNVIWNQCPPNSEWYVVDNLKDILDIIKFDTILKNEGL